MPIFTRARLVSDICNKRKESQWSLLNYKSGMSKEIGISLQSCFKTFTHFVPFERISLARRIYKGNKRNKPSAKRSWMHRDLIFFIFFEKQVKVLYYWGFNFILKVYFECRQTRKRCYISVSYDTIVFFWPINFFLCWNQSEMLWNFKWSL